ncbi:MAG: hypothetical protein Q8S96_00780 [Hydrogenophaga sp.]|uniref:hypothetical protein n=1 Tax=Hydrogenophaga sp. TaxID=1904254 RepID=UPI0027193789|nr:hypothetical protein [Hydrogenophaga sp.]MDO9483988.1 hypothetical protein [Hydrogenophaga sp.]MDP3342981.1 hypothetical protein [Hydrogenophaga sp.]MDP3808245.1 hypothetical protein [Hydrogenophaga sp.]MDP3923538.1 hypothetical protein [Hydrogenophaga sp.]
MQPLPNNPHDWALWLLDRLETVQQVESHWEGTLPGEFDFDEVVNAIPEQLKGLLDPLSRRIEFHPELGGVFQNIDELVNGPRRRAPLPVFTVRGLNYTHGKTQPVPQAIINYLDAARLWQLLSASADYQLDQAVVFIKTFESKVEVRADYRAQDLCQLDGLANFAAAYFDSDHHKEQKRNIIRSSLLEVCKGALVVRLSDLLPRFDDLVERVKASYSLYTADFSFEKLRSEVDKQNVDDTLRLNKTLSDIQNQLLALPAALMLAGAGVKDKVWSTNLSIWIGVTVFIWVMHQLVKNQQSSIASIDQEIQLRVERVKEQPADVSQRVLPRFHSLQERVTSQKSVLRNIRHAVLLVWFVATTIVVNAQWPGFLCGQFSAAWDCARKALEMALEWGASH